VDHGFPDAPPAEASDKAVGDAPLVKRRRRAYFVFDDKTEIPREQYQGYVNDRASITQRSCMDYTIFLPHYAPSQPNFTTTFTDLCSALVESLQRGTEVAEKRRRIMQEAELRGHGDQFFKQAAQMAERLEPRPQVEAAGSTEAPKPIVAPSPVIPVSPGISEPAGPPSFAAVLSPLNSPFLEVAGLRSPGAPPCPSPAPETPRLGVTSPPIRVSDDEPSKRLLMSAPATMGGVVTGNMDQEDQSGNAAARIGYSGRTEKMHGFLAKEFKETRSDALSYEALCRMQAAGRRELIAGCFFELLVLKTNGVISLNQDAPLADIRISKDRLFAV